MSGINITDECVNAFNDLKQKHLYSFVIFKIDKDQKNVVVDCKGEKDATHADFTKALLDAKDEGRYAVYDYKFGDKKSKLVFLMWVKEDIPVKQRMIYSATKAAVKKMVGVETEVQCNDLEDLSEDSFLEKCKGKYD